MKTRDGKGGEALGWLSLAIGAAEAFAPRKVEQLLGIDHHPHHRGLMRMMGWREILHGVSILATKRREGPHTSAVTARVVGDVLDTALLGLAATKTRRPIRFAAVAATVLAIGAIDMLASSRLRRQAQNSRWR